MSAAQPSDEASESQSSDGEAQSSDGEAQSSDAKVEASDAEVEASDAEAQAASHPVRPSHLPRPQPEQGQLGPDEAAPALTGAPPDDSEAPVAAPPPFPAPSEPPESPAVDPGNGTLAGHAILAKLAWAMRSEPGDVRPHNEDFGGVFAPTIPDDAWDRGPLFIVCDGLGGHAAGEVASRTAVEAMLAFWTTGTLGAPHQSIRSAIRAANLAVFDAALQSKRRGMATTCTALTLAGKEAVIGHVGDSRCYLVRGEATTQLTNDHSRVGEMMRSGLITPEQAANHPSRSMISRTVGSEPSVNVDIIKQPTQAGDTFVLCSDGLWDVVGRREIQAVVGAIGTPEMPTAIAAADTLIEQALARNTPDNVTVLVVRVTTDRPVPPVSTRRGFLWRGR